MGENLKEKIEKDFKEALKERKGIKISTLKLLKAEISKKEKEKRYKIATQKPNLGEKELEKESQLTDQEIVKIVFSEIKKREEAISEFEKGKRGDLVNKEREEIEILKRYIPELLSESEIEKIVKETIEKVKAKEIKDLGKVMKELMPKIQQRAEGGKVAEIVKKFLIKK
jgi:hypothetical protein